MIDFCNLKDDDLLGCSEVEILLKNKNTRFVVHNFGQIQHIDDAETMRFWNDQVKQRLVEPPEAIDGFALSDYPNHSCFIAWKHICDDYTYVLLKLFH